MDVVVAHFNKFSQYYFRQVLVRRQFKTNLSVIWHYRGADKSLARPDWKKINCSHISSNAELIADAETWLDGQPSELSLSGLQKLEFGRCSLFPSWLG